MAVPKRKTSVSKRKMRRSHHAIVPAGMSECPECGEMMRPHHACPHCGTYKGRAVKSSAED
ncbi:50S ribosomal protein L32 [Mariprofundus sp. EBB-1]|uniref:50S ribosomal protein L32 n=1 Tax=Mariprofundus sp. EBB-1 TaxID=2650971 RepID=UPI000EF1D2EC|nr:50S ribosomal protein L32 [Mariprofundus sp. EBB-1]RLL54999.1 50S ribosomal protein L32 [Mariprofundus sp. EBB-1]